MRRATAIAAIAAVGMIALADNASAFHGKSARYVVYPSYCSPYTYLYYPVKVKSHTPCWYKHQMKAAYRYGCYPGTGCGGRTTNAVLGGYPCGGFAGCSDGCGGSCYGGGGCYDGGCGVSCGGGCYDGGCGAGGCGTGGCATGGCATGGCAGCNGGGSTVTEGGETQGDVIYDGPAAGAPVTEPAAAEPEPEPAGDTSASKGQGPFRLTATTRRDATAPAAGQAAFERGIRMMRDGQTQQSLEAFYEASTAEPNNAMYLYHQALALHDTQGAEAAQATLTQAIETERQAPVSNWGKRMERVQGKSRLWIEKARRDAGLTR